MNAHDVIPFVVAEVEHHARASEARVVDDDVETTPSVQGPLDERVPRGGFADVTPVRHGRATRGLDVAYHVSRGILVGRRAVGRDTRVLDHHPRAVRGEAQGVRAADAAPRTGDDRYPVPEIHCPI